MLKVYVLRCLERTALRCVSIAEEIRGDKLP